MRLLGRACDVSRAAVGVHVLAKQTQRALVLPDTLVIVLMKPLAAWAARRDMMAGAVLGENVIPDHAGHVTAWS